MEFPKDPVIEAYKKHVDRSLIRENLRLTVHQRLQALTRWQETAAELCGHRPPRDGLGPIFRALQDAGVEYFLDGELAAVIDGATEFTMKLDLVYLRTPANSARLASALRSFHPKARETRSLPFKFASFDRTFLQTDLGAMDLSGVTESEFGILRGDTFELNAFGVRLRVLKRDRSALRTHDA
jgi:hypothetical protein